VRTSVNELYERMARIIGYERAPERLPGRTGELDHISVDPGLAGRLLDWQPRVGLDEGLTGTIDWVRESIAGAER
jgi:UDP-glucose 4-epimerase